MVNNAFVVNGYEPDVLRMVSDPAGFNAAAAVMWFPPPVITTDRYFTGPAACTADGMAGATSSHASESSVNAAPVRLAVTSTVIRRFIPAGSDVTSPVTAQPVAPVGVYTVGSFIVTHWGTSFAPGTYRHSVPLM